MLPEDPEELNLIGSKAKEALSNPRISNLALLAVDAWRLYHLARTELNKASLNSLVLEMVLRSMEAKASNPFSAQELATHLGKVVIPFLEKERHVRRRELAALKSRMANFELSLPPEGLPLPSQSMREKTERFAAGRLFIVTGEEPAVYAWLTVCRDFWTNLKYRIMWFAHRKVEFRGDSTLVVQPGWWVGVCSNEPDSSLDGVLEPAIDNQTPILIIENLNIMVKDAGSSELIDSALTQLRTWSAQNKVSILIGLPLPTGSDPFKCYECLSDYSVLPVSLGKVALPDGTVEPRVIGGSDTFVTKEDVK